ncbi:MAG: hypothetical protein RL088_3778, partial [Verrucomicrobiota bacterium]
GHWCFVPVSTRNAPESACNVFASVVWTLVSDNSAESANPETCKNTAEAIEARSGK